MMDENVLKILEDPVIESDEGQISPIGSHIEPITKSYDYQEKSYEDKICKVLDIEGELMYERQKKVKTGIIDIFVYGQPPWIVEVKRAGTPFYLIQAITQLKFYELCFPRKCRLFVAVPGGVPDEYLPILDEFHIEVFNADKNIRYWQGVGRL